MKNNRVLTLKSILWLITGIASTVMIFRLIRGLGVTTNLTDKTPWGLWIGFDVFSGVALAAGGFVVCAIVYVFHLEKFRPLARPAVLTAFLGYVAVAVGLFFDLGLPWRIWHPAIYWQYHSALFEVAWCVMLYLTVLLLEFSPTVLEKAKFSPFRSLLKVLKRFTIVFVILGIMLSVLHQSSLGTLFMLMPSRLHPLWYSSIQPLLFFVSAVGLGMAMVTMESVITSWLYRREYELNLLSRLAKGIPFILLLYAVFRIGEIIVRGNTTYIIDGTWPGYLFIFEMIISVFLPAVLFSLPRIRQFKEGLLVAAGLVVFGFIMHRIDVSIISSFQITGSVYFPSFIEIITSLGIVSIAMLVFLFFVENFSVYPGRGAQEVETIRDVNSLSDGRIFNIGFGDERRFSMVYILGVALAVFILPQDGLWEVKPESTPVQHAKIIISDTLQESMNQTTPLLLINGNRDVKSVLFPHYAHIGRASCSDCHHLNLVNANVTACSECHLDMYLDTDIFDHRAHRQVKGGNRGCKECHKNAELPKNRTTSVSCSSCHKEMKAASKLIHLENNWDGFAAGYMHAMHGLCLNCHEQEEKKRGQVRRTGISGCITCHPVTEPKEQVLTSAVVSTEGSR